MKKDETPSVSRCVPIFIWEKCDKCKKEFRREKGWKNYGGPYVNNIGQFRYLCQDCGPDKKTAQEYFKNRKIERPLPPPPMQRTISKSSDKLNQFFEELENG